MAETKCVIGLAGKSYQKTCDNQFVGMKIGSKVDGGLLGLKNYELEITGGSDTSGFPIRKCIDGAGRKKGFFGKGVGVRKRINRKGKRIRKTVAGNIVSDRIAQLNFKVLKKGTEELEKLMPKEENKK